MTTDNRTTLNACDANTNWTGDDGTPSSVTALGLYYENGNSLSFQHTNTDEHTYYTDGTGWDLSDATVFLIVKVNQQDTQANRGMQYVLGDGTDRIGFAIGGSDNTGVSLTKLFYGLSLDVTNRGAFGSNVYAGVLANLTTTAITQVGYGSSHLAKAQGAVDNIYLDRLSYIANDSAAITINGGTVGTPETWLDVAGDDDTNGWGVCGNPKASQFDLNCSFDLGDATASTASYFTMSGVQLYLLGQGYAAGHFFWNLIANSGATNQLIIDGSQIISVAGSTGVPCNLTWTETNFNNLQVDGSLFVDIGTLTLPTNSVNRWFRTTTFDGPTSITPNGMELTGCAFVAGPNTRGDGLLILDTAGDSNNMADCTFTDDGNAALGTPGHMIEVTATGSYDFDNLTFAAGVASPDRNEAVYNNSGGSITLNILNGGDTPSVWPDAGGAAITRSSYNWQVGAASGTTLTLSMGVAIVEGETWIIVTRNTGDQDPTGVASGSRDFTLVSRSYDSGLDRTLGVWVYYDCAAGMGAATVTWGTAVTNRGCVGWVLSDGDISEVEFNAQTNPGTGTDAITSGGALTQTSNNEFIIGVCEENESNTLSAGTGYTSEGAIWSNAGHAEYDALAGTTGDVGATFTSSSATTDTFTVGIIIQARVTTISNNQPLKVDGVTRGTSCKIISEQTVGTITRGDVLLEGFADANGEVTDSLNYEAAFNPDGLLVRAQARNQGIFCSCQVEDSGTGFTDETSDLNSSTASDVLIWPATPAVNDAIYFGHTDPFGRMKMVIGTARSGPTTLTTVWEYWNGLSWASVTVDEDGVTDWDTAGTFRYQITGSTTGWATTSVNSITGLYWIRNRITALTGAFTTVPALSRANHDGDRYLPFDAIRRFTSTGLTVTASWNPDTISKFDPAD